MLTCVACPKNLGSVSLRDQNDDDETRSTRQAIKTLTSQIKDMALKASGAYRHCKPCTGARYDEPSELASGSERFHYSNRWVGSGGGGGFGFSGRSTPSLRGISSGEGTPSEDAAAAAAAATVFVDEDEEAREWVAQVEPGVLLTFFAMPQGRNDLKRIRFSQEMFNKWQARRWWAENHDKVMELYNVARFNRHSIPLPNPPPSEDESSKMESAQESPKTPPLRKEELPRHFHRTMNSNGTCFMGYSSSDSMDYQPVHFHRHPLHNHHIYRHCYDFGGLPSTPKLSSIGGAKTEVSSMDASIRTSSYPDEADHSGELSTSVSNASDKEREWVEEDEPGVYITIHALSGGIRELCRIRFSYHFSLQITGPNKSMSILFHPPLLFPLFPVHAHKC